MKPRTPGLPNGTPMRLGGVEASASGFGFSLLDEKGLPLASFEFVSAEEAERARVALRGSGKGASVAAGRLEPQAASRTLVTPPNSVRQAEYGWRQRIYVLLEEGMTESRLGRLIEGALVALIVLNVVAVALESVPSIYAQFRPFFARFEEFSLAVFTGEYVLRVWSAVEDPRIAARGPLRGRLTFAVRPLMLIDFLSFAPSYLGLFLGIDLRVLRIFRLFRLLKLARYSQALQALLGVLLAERNALFASIVLLLSTMCLEGELMHLAEGSVQPRVLGTLPGAMYWALTTLTTVGYGDITPVTVLGKFVASITMVTGLALFALPIGIIANGFVTGLNRRRFPVTWNMLRRQAFLQGLDVKALNEVIESATAALVKEHAQIVLRGKEATEFYLIMSGSAGIESVEGTEEFGPGEIIGAEALHHSSTYSRTVTAHTDMRMLVIPGDELRRLVRKYPLLRSRVSESLTRHRIGEGADPGERLRQLEDENARLRNLIIDGILEKVPAR